jgi:tetratricopeptide (TPR) repeat protein
VKREARNTTTKSRLLPALFLLLSGCASIPDEVRSLPSDVSTELDDTPFFPQERYQCGPAALTTALVSSGADTSLDDVVDAVFLPGRQGSLQLELVAAARQYDRLPYVIDGTLAAVKGELEAGRPVLVLQNLGIAALPRWHYAVVVGIDVEKADVVLRSGTERRRATSIDTFLRTWRRADYWGIVLLRPDERPRSVDRKRYVSTVTALEETGRYDAASRAWRTALERWPTNRVALFGLANAEFRRGRLEAAEAGYRELLDIDSGHVAARNNLAWALAEQGRFEEALDEVAEAARRNDDAALQDELRDTELQILEMAEQSR